MLSLVFASSASKGTTGVAFSRKQKSSQLQCCRSFLLLQLPRARRALPSAESKSRPNCSAVARFCFFSFQGHDGRCLQPKAKVVPTAVLSLVFASSASKGTTGVAFSRKQKSSQLQ